jgi:formylglycine-generating enzyme required for sulfatase activity
MKVKITVPFLLLLVLLSLLSCENPLVKGMVGETGKKTGEPQVGDKQVVTVVDGITFTMIYVPAGSFLVDANNGAVEMSGGDTDWVPPYFSRTELRSSTNEEAKKKEVIDEGYWMGETEITRKVWFMVMDRIPDPDNNMVNGDKPEDRPVVDISFYDMLAFCNTLSEKNGKESVYSIPSSPGSTTLITDPHKWKEDGDWVETMSQVKCDKTKSGYRLPSEKEWMWAAMGATRGDGDHSGGVFMDGYKKIFAGAPTEWEDYSDTKLWPALQEAEKQWPGWKALITGEMQAVKKFALMKNEIGLYDMSGNVSEMCWDLGHWDDGTGYVSLYCPADKDPLGESYKSSLGEHCRIYKGGSWGAPPTISSTTAPQLSPDQQTSTDFNVFADESHVFDISFHGVCDPATPSESPLDSSLDPSKRRNTIGFRVVRAAAE